MAARAGWSGPAGTSRPGEGRLALLALGNVLQGDDGVGPFALEYFMSRWRVSQDVTVCDLGTPGTALAEHLLGFERVVLLDAFQGPPPGALVRWEAGAGSPRRRGGVRHCHDAAVGDAVALAGLFDPPTRVVVLGVRVAEVRLGVGLSRAVRLSVPALAMLAADELVAAGAVVSLRSDPAPLPGVVERGSACGGTRALPKVTRATPGPLAGGVQGGTPTRAGPPSAARGRAAPTAR
jgi:hydrogenase maturation protease